MSTLLLYATATFALMDWFSVHTDRRHLEAIAKPAVIIALMIWVATVDPTAEEVTGGGGLTAVDPAVRDIAAQTRAWVLGALALSLAGDVLLLPQLDRFIPGLLAFLLGHLAFIPALAPHTRPGALVAAAAFMGPVAIIVGRRVVMSAKARHGSTLAGAVTVYVVAVATTAALAAGTGIPLVVAGGILFATSDGILGWNRFIAPLPHGRTLTHVTYHLAQIGLAMIVAA